MWYPVWSSWSCRINVNFIQKYFFVIFFLHSSLSCFSHLQISQSSASKSDETKYECVYTVQWSAGLRTLHMLDVKCRGDRLVKCNLNYLDPIIKINNRKSETSPFGHCTMSRVSRVTILAVVALRAHDAINFWLVKCEENASLMAIYDFWNYEL